jgi:predicted enzyme related to lactoylglutathione lyase
MQSMKHYKIAIWIITVSLSVVARATNSVGFFEISACDLNRAKVFYESTFDWKLTFVSDQFLSIEGAGIGGGIVKDCRPTGERINTKVFVRVDDLEKSFKLSQKNGATVVIEPMQVSPQSWIAEILDPENSLIGLMQEGRK